MGLYMNHRWGDLLVLITSITGTITVGVSWTETKNNWLVTGKLYTHWRHLPFIPSLFFRAKFQGISPQHMALYGTVPPINRILKWPLFRRGPSLLGGYSWGETFVAIMGGKTPKLGYNPYNYDYISRLFVEPIWRIIPFNNWLITLVSNIHV